MDMIINRARRAELGGQVAVIFAIGLTAFLLILGAGVDFGHALAVKTAQSGSLEAMSEACMAQANAVKFSDRPGDEARSQVIELLAESGFTGTARIWYVEAPRSETGPSDRFGGTLVSLEQLRPTALLGLAGIEEVAVRSEAAWVTHPYSTAEVYRPPSDAGGWVEVRMADGEVRSTSSGSSTLAGAPAALRDAIDAAMGGDGNQP